MRKVRGALAHQRWSEALATARHFGHAPSLVSMISLSLDATSISYDS